MSTNIIGLKLISRIINTRTDISTEVSEEELVGYDIEEVVEAQDLKEQILVHRDDKRKGYKQDDGYK